MSSLTLSIPVELKHKMESFEDINWSAVARAAIINKIELLERINGLLFKSKLTEENTIKYGQTINKCIWKKHKTSHKCN